MKAIEDMLVSIALEHPQERMLACLGVASVCEFGTSDADVRSINDASRSTMQSVLEKLVTEAKAKKEILGPRSIRQQQGAIFNRHWPA